nr:formin-like protein 5 [Aegilops tauschii subsp. strangulata]
MATSPEPPRRIAGRLRRPPQHPLPRPLLRAVRPGLSLLSVFLNAPPRAHAPALGCARAAPLRLLLLQPRRARARRHTFPPPRLPTSAGGQLHPLAPRFPQRRCSSPGPPVLAARPALLRPRKPLGVAPRPCPCIAARRPARPCPSYRVDAPLLATPPPLPPRLHSLLRQATPARGLAPCCWSTVAAPPLAAHAGRPCPAPALAGDPRTFPLAATSSAARGHAPPQPPLPAPDPGRPLSSHSHCARSQLRRATRSTSARVRLHRAHMTRRPLAPVPIWPLAL